MPPLFSPKPPLLPVTRPQKLFIYSVFTLNKSLKNYPKHLKYLKIESKPSKDYHHDPHILSKYRFKSLQRRVKSLKVLNLEQHKQFFELKVPQALGLLRSFKNLAFLTLMKKPVLKTSYTHPDFKWLTVEYPSHDSNLYRSQNLFLLKSRLIRSHKRPRLLSFDPKDLKDFVEKLEKYRLEFSESTLDKLKRSPKSLLTKFHFNISHLHFQLHRFRLPGDSNDLLHYLSRLPNPSEISHLTVFVPDIAYQNDENSLELQKAMKQLQSLCSLNMESHSFLCIYPLSKYSEASSNLSKLSLQIPIQNPKELIELALFIGTLKNLSFLSIKNSKYIQGYADKGYRRFFTQISELAQLKSLQIDLCGEIDSSQKSEFFHGCLGEFASCVERLHELQEIKFGQSEFALALEFDLLAKALKKKGSKLKKLKLKFVNGEKKVDHLKKLNKALEKMENLEELDLKNVLTEKESLVQFAEVISELQRIKSVQLDGEDPYLKPIDSVRALKRILMKYGLEDLKWLGSYPVEETEPFEGFDWIDIKEIIWKNSRLHSIHLDYFKEVNRGIGFRNVQDFLS